MTKKPLDLFEVLKDINFIKSYALHHDPDFEKAFDPFMVNRFLSMNAETTIEANFMNRYWSLPKNAKYLFLSDVIEKKNRFLKYIKNDQEKEDKEMIKWLTTLYLVNKDVAMGMLKTITEEEKELIKTAYTQKTIRKR